MKVIGNLTKDAIIRAAVSEGLSVTQALGSASVFESAGISLTGATFDSTNNKVVIAYRDSGNSQYGTAVVGTVSGNSISFGTPVVFRSANAVPYDKSVVFDTNSNKVVISYADAGNGYSIVGTVSGTSISFGTAVNFDNSIGYPSAAFDSANNKVVVMYQDGENSDRGSAIVGTVSGTSISFGSISVFETGTTTYSTAAYDSNAGKIVVAYRDGDNSGHGTAAVGTVSGTSVSFGTPVVFKGASASYISMAYDSTAQKVVILYQDNNAGTNHAIVGTVSGTSISFGSEANVSTGGGGSGSIVYDSTANRSVVCYEDGGNSNYGTLKVGTVSGTSISFGDAAVFETAESKHFSTVFDSNSEKVVIAYRDDGNSNYGTSVVVQVGYSSATGGTIADGKPVIVNANGTVSTISTSAIVAGSAQEFQTGNNVYTDLVYDSNAGKVVFAYEDNDQSRHGRARVGTISGTSISYGTEASFSVQTTNAIGIGFDSNSNKVLIVYTDVGNSSYGTAIVGTVSGTNISFGSPTVFHSASTIGELRAVFDSNSNKFAVIYLDQADSNKGRAIVGTISGTSVSFGSEATFSSTTVGSEFGATFDSNSNKVVIAYRDHGGSTHGECIVGTISGTSISFGSLTAFASESVQYPNISFDATTNKCLVTYYGANTHGYAIVGTVSGTSISFGTAAVFNADKTEYASPASGNGNNLISYRDRNDSNKLKIIQATISGTSVSFGTDISTLNDSVVYTRNAAAGTKFVIATRANSDPRGVAYVAEPGSPNLTTENFVGFMNGAALDGTNGEILSSCSIARNQTSLTPGQTYFVTSTGALSTTAGDPSVTAGTAISSTELIVKG